MDTLLSINELLSSFTSKEQIQTYVNCIAENSTLLTIVKSEISIVLQQAIQIDCIAKADMLIVQT